MSFTGRAIVVLLAFLLAACAGSPRRPVVVDEGLSGPIDPPGYHYVQPGDTLYSLSLRYDRDYRELARINHLGEDYRILVGQKLALNPPPAPPPPPAPKVAPVQVQSAPAETPLVAKALPPAIPSPVGTVVPAKNVPAKASTTKSKAADTQKAVTNPPPPVAGVSQNTPPVGAPEKRVTESTDTDADISWAWPIHGQIIANFSPAALGNKGLDIAGRRGDAVMAAADGVVVYVGSGLVGYGKLIIIRHNNNYLSAYAHNDRFAVTEGQRVKVGDKIAELGSSGADRDELHFEIRRQGKPVNPLQYLPAR